MFIFCGNSQKIRKKKLRIKFFICLNLSLKFNSKMKDRI